MLGLGKLAFLASLPLRSRGKPGAEQ
jgi:hypothetical protein